MAPMFDRKIFTLKFFKVDLWAFWSQWSSWSCCVYNVWLWLSITLQLCCDALFDPKCNHATSVHVTTASGCWMVTPTELRLYMVVQHAQQDWVISVRGTCATQSERASCIPQTPDQGVIASVFVSRCPCLSVCARVACMCATYATIRGKMDWGHPRGIRGMQMV